MKRGYIICFKGTGFTFHVLSFLLGLFDKEWRKRSWKPWHLAILYSIERTRTVIIESTAGGVRFNILSGKEGVDWKSYQWLDKAPTGQQMHEWAVKYLGQPYDCIGYATTVLSYLSKVLFNRPFRVIDRDYYCWELGSMFAIDFGKPFVPLAEKPTIAEIMRALEGEL